MTSQAFRFFSDCVGWPKGKVDALIDMKDRAREIKMDTFLSKVSFVDIRDLSKSLGYASMMPRGAHVRHAGLSFSEDRYITYHRSSLPGPDGKRVPCYYLTHSSMEYVFTVPGFRLG